MARKSKENNDVQIDRQRAKSYADRYERIMEEIKSGQAARKDLLAEMKSHGYETKEFIQAMKVKEIGLDTYEAERLAKDSKLHAWLNVLGMTSEPERELAY